MQRVGDDIPPNITNQAAEEKCAFIHVVLPAYNEEEALPVLLDRFANHRICSKLRVWVVNDGSKDKTGEFALQRNDKLSVTLLNHPVNLGLGQALQTGISAAVRKGRPDDVLVVMDADDTHDIDLIEPMVSNIDEGDDIVIASRFVMGGDDRTAPQFRRFLSRGAAWVFTSVLPLQGINDFTSGYRAYRMSLLANAKTHWGDRLIEERGFACMVELLLKLRYWSPKISEVPIVLRYDRKLGASKINISRTIFQYFQMTLRDRFEPPPIEVDIEKMRVGNER